MKSSLFLAFVGGLLLLLVSSMMLAKTSNSTSSNQTTTDSMTTMPSTTNTQTSLPVCQIDQQTNNRIICNCSGGGLTFSYKNGELNLQCI